MHGIWRDCLVAPWTATSEYMPENSVFSDRMGTAGNELSVFALPER